MTEILGEYLTRLALRLDEARAVLAAPAITDDPDQPFDALAEALETAEFLGLAAIVPFARRLAEARIAAGPLSAHWDGTGRDGIAKVFDDLDRSLIAERAKAAENPDPEADTPEPVRESPAEASREAEPPEADPAEAETPELDTPEPVETGAETIAENTTEKAPEPAAETVAPDAESAETVTSEPPPSAAEIMRIPLDRIEIGDRLRGVVAGGVAVLARSIAEIGLRNPITVIVGGDDRWVLVAGRQRLEAARSLGWDSIPATVLPADGVPAVLWEIDENLVRAELTRLERDQHLLRRKELFDAVRVAETGRASPGLGGRGKKGFAGDAADRLGYSKRSINEAIRRASRIPEGLQAELKEIGADDSAAELNALSRLTPDQQADAVARLKKGEAKTLRQACALARGRAAGGDPEKTDASFKRMVMAWNAGDRDSRVRFLNWLISTGAMNRAAGSETDDTLAKTDVETPPESTPEAAAESPAPDATPAPAEDRATGTGGRHHPLRRPVGD